MEHRSRCDTWAVVLVVIGGLLLNVNTNIPSQTTMMKSIFDIFPSFVVDINRERPTRFDPAEQEGSMI